MALIIGTHSGTFHADDVLAFALIRTFVDAEATVVRTRDRDRLAACDVVVDVGGEFDPDRLRFDHHQGSYRGPRSSAGMVLDWLEASGRVTPDLAHHLRHRVVDYIDDVDTGREAPQVRVPCFAHIVEAIGDGTESPESQQAAFLEATDVGAKLLRGLRAGYERVCEARLAVKTAMADAVRDHRSVVFLDRYYPWKPIYFEFGGETHPTDFVLFPSDDETWKVVAVPPSLGRFEQKRSLPDAWAGKMGDELAEATGVAGAIFCHKNRFIAVFRTRDDAIEAMRRFDLYDARPDAVLPEAGSRGR